MNKILQLIVTAIKNSPREDRENLVCAISDFQEKYPRSFRNVMRVPQISELLKMIDENI